jgi:hypothetical protein
MLLKEFKVCLHDDCLACSCIQDLLATKNVKDFIASPKYVEEKLDVISTLSDCSHGAANYSQVKYYASREVYDDMDDIMVDIYKFGLFVTLSALQIG